MSHRKMTSSNLEDHFINSITYNNECDNDYYSLLDVPEKIELTVDITQCATHRELLLFDLTFDNSSTVNDYLEAYKNAWDLILLIENHLLEVIYIDVKTIITNLSKYMIIVKGGLLHMWSKYKTVCYALLDWTGYWRLYSLVPCHYHIGNSRVFDDVHVHYLDWDNENCMYEILLDTKSDAMLPSTLHNDNKIGSTFKSLTYCKFYVNAVVERLYYYSR